MCFALAPCPHTLSPHLVPTPCLFTLRPHTLSPHLVSLRFVAALCPYALSKAKAQATEAQKARPIVLVLVLGPRYYRYCRACRYCRRVSTGIDRYRQVATGAMASTKGAPVWRGHSCRRGIARAGRNACPTLPRSSTAASRDPTAPRLRRTGGVALPALARLCGNFPGHSTPIDPHRPHQPPSTPSTPIGAGYRRRRHLQSNGGNEDECHQSQITNLKSPPVPSVTPCLCESSSPFRAFAFRGSPKTLPIRSAQIRVIRS